MFGNTAFQFFTALKYLARVVYSLYPYNNHLKAGDRTRTCDRLITNQQLYQLSYTSTVIDITREKLIWLVSVKKTHYSDGVVMLKEFCLVLVNDYTR